MFVKMMLATVVAVGLAACSSSVPTTGGVSSCRHAELAASTLSSGAYDEMGEVMMPAKVPAQNWRMEASAAPTH